MTGTWDDWEREVSRRVADGSIWDEVARQRPPEVIAAEYLKTREANP